MFLLILVLLVAMPLAELWAIISVAEVIGGWQTIALLLIDSLIGAWLLKAQGRGVLAKLDERLRAGELPTDELVDGLLILVAGALMLTPGFITASSIGGSGMGFRTLPACDSKAPGFSSLPNMMRSFRLGERSPWVTQSQMSPPCSRKVGY